MSRRRRKTGRRPKPKANPPPPSRAPSVTFAEFLRTRRWWVSGGLVLLHLLLCIALFEPKIHTGGDSATYVLLAESILEAGDGYALALEPGPPEPHTKYPPGYPLFLAPLVFLFGRNFVVLKLLSLVFTALSVLVFCAYAGKRREPVPWFLLALAFAVSPGVIDYSRWMLSEAPFLFFTLGALWMLREDREDTGIGRHFWLGLAASIMSFYVRSIGALLLVAGSLSYLFRREWRKFLVHGAVGAGLTLPWLVRTRLVTGTASSYLEEFRLQNVYSPEAGYLDVGGLVGRFFENAGLYATRELPRALAGSDSTWAGSALVVMVGVVLCALVLFALVRVFRRRPDAAALYFVLTGVAIMLFQSSVNDVRYLVPLIPLFLSYGADAATVLAGRARRAATRTLVPCCFAAVLALVALGAHAARIPGNLDMVARYAAGDRYAGYHPAWRSFFEASSWVEENTPDDAVVTVRKPRLFNALTGRRVKLYPYSTDTDSVFQVVRGTDYVLIDAIFPTTQRYLVPALQEHIDVLDVVHQTEAPVTLVLGVRDAVPNPDP